MHLTRKVIIKAIALVCICTTIIIPSVYLISNWLNNTEIVVNEILLNITFTFVVTLSITSANLFTFRFFENKYAGHKGYWRIFLVEMFITSVNAAVIISIIVYLFYIVLGEFPKGQNEKVAALFFENIIVALIVNAIACGLAEAYIIFRRWKETLILTERLQREKAESQYIALKSQVNPHFLFNSLNTLSSLIRTSPDKAIGFVDKFSKIYRYVLDSSDKMLITVRQELDFINSYIFLQKIRFGDAINIDIQIESEYMNDFIPPLSLQLLVENAFKHNEASQEAPLQVKIFVENSNIVVMNNLQMKRIRPESTGIGLKNLQARYNQLCDAMPEFYTTEKQYIAKIPLIKDEQ
ncbi:MAG TPA: histidine kinase [Bacteroidales bacterium]|nr:histidine kinase [Bacteroidales bacterium]